MTNKKGRIWTNDDLKKLRNLAKKGISTPEIAKELKRTKVAIYNKASDKNIKLKPKDN